MNAKSGKAGSPVSPTEPKDALVAATANPGEVDQLKAEKSQESAATKPHKEPKTKEEKKKKKSWIEIELVDEADQPVAGERYKVTLPDGSVAEGTLDEKGLAKIKEIEPGSCKITFPDLDKDAWEPA